MDKVIKLILNHFQMKERTTMNLAKKVILSLITSSIISSAYASESDTIKLSGSAKLTQQQFINLNVSGKLEAESISSSGLIKVSGSAQINNSHLHNLRASGSVSLDHSQINGNINTSGSLKISQSKLSGGELANSGSINSDNSTYLSPIKLSGKLSSELDQFDAPISGSGSIYAKNSRFRRVINLSSSKSSWTNSSIESDIFIKSDNELFSSNIPTLTFNDTQVHGNISFTQAKGLVILNGNSKIMGKVLNAEIKQAQN